MKPSTSLDSAARLLSASNKRLAKVKRENDARIVGLYVWIGDELKNMLRPTDADYLLAFGCTDLLFTESDHEASALCGGGGMGTDNKT